MLLGRKRGIVLREGVPLSVNCENEMCSHLTTKQVLHFVATDIVTDLSPM